MWRRVRPPLFVVVLALFVLIALLAGLQYRWLGQISEAERERLRAGLTTAASEFATDFDRELARAFLMFQMDGADAAPGEESVSARFAARYDRWQASSQYPKLLRDFYIVSQAPERTMQLSRFDPVSRRFAAAEWPPTMAAWRDRLANEDVTDTGRRGTVFIRRLPAALWESIPAIVVPAPMIFMSQPQPRIEIASTISYSVLTIDLDYVTRELLPSLMERHFNQAAAGPRYQVAVVSREGTGKVVFQSDPGYAPAADARADATADLFQVRPQDFATLAGEVRRFIALTASKVNQHVAASGSSRIAIGESRPMSLVVQSRPGAAGPPGALVDPANPSRALRSTLTATTTVSTHTAPSQWKLLVAHPAGSLEAAVNSQRRRNLAVSSSVLGLLGVSMGLLVLSTRRAQRLARQQMEFVATVSHELRTPLAVIRAAAENLADGVVADEEGIRRYGELMRTEGRRLTDMVEQILEFAGIQSGQRGFSLRPVAVALLVRDIITASAALIESAGLEVELDLPDRLPPVLGDEPALRRVFQNLLDNAIKYGASGGWVLVRARAAGSQMLVTVADRGIGIDPSEQARIFEPFYRAGDVVAAQMQGAGLGLSLVQRIVVAHGGRVTVKSTPRHGSEFTVELPIAGDAPLATGVSSQWSETPSTTSSASGEERDLPSPAAPQHS
jgi:signal transduction histidine kinase